MGGLVSSVLGTVGGLVSGGKAAAANAQQAAAFRDAATYGRDQAAFQPFGITTGFGSSQFSTDPNTGRVTSAGYTLDPRLQSVQNQLASQFGNINLNPDVSQFQTGANQAFGAGSSLFNLGQQYIAQSPQEVAQRYVSQQQGLLQPGRAADIARMSAANYGRGTGGLGVNTGTGGGPSNPLAQALFNAQSRQDQEIASRAEQEGRAQALFGADLYRQGAGLNTSGAGLLGSMQNYQNAAYNPLRTSLGLFSDVEKLGMTPYQMSLNLGQTISDAGARQGEFVMSGERQAAPSSLRYSAYSPLGTAIQGAGSIAGSSGGQQLGSWFSGLFNQGPERLA